MKKTVLWEDILDYAVITFGTALIAASVFFFMMPSHVALGSVSGLSIILANFLPLPVSSITMILNLALLGLGFIFIGRDFGAKTVYTTVLLPLMLGLLEKVFPENASLTQDPLSDMICFLFLCSLGQSILFKRNASSGGLDIVGKIMNKFFRMELGKAISMVGMCVALSSAFAYDSRTVVLSVLGTYLNGIVLDHFIFNSNMTKRVCILSEQEEKLLHYITEDLHSGATIYQARGAYTDEPRNEIITIVNMHEYRQLMNFIQQNDPKAFITVYNVNEVIYRPKTVKAEKH